MSNRRQIAEALRIAERYDPEGFICAEHDVIYVGDFQATDVDRQALEELGFHYRLNEGWTCFV